MDDLFALLPGDLGPVVRIRRIRQILVLFELVPDSPEQILSLDAFLVGGDRSLDGLFLGSRYDALNQRAAG